MRGTRSLLGGLALLLATTAPQAAELRELRLWQGPDSTRAVLDLDARATYNVFALSNPDRLVIDIAGTRRAASLKFDQGAKGVIRDVRSGPHEGGLRLVMDLNAPVSPKASGSNPAAVTAIA